MLELIAGSKKSLPPSENSPDKRWVLRLFVAGQTVKSLVARSNLARICEQYMPNRYQVEVIDLLTNPHLAKIDQIIAIPTLVRDAPTPVRKIIGDLSNTERVLSALEICSAGVDEHGAK